jgi:hypothetical protein
MKKLLIILILNISLLFSPSPVPGTTDPNGRYVHLNRQMGFFLNPDTYGFILTAIDPSQLFADKNLRQARPLFILIGTATGYTINLLTSPFHHKLIEFYRKFWRGIYPERLILLMGNFYLGYFLLNVLVLWLSLYLFEKVFDLLVTPGRPANYVKYILMVFIVSNPITKAFFWTVHQQMFAFLTPLLCIYLLLRLCRLKSPFSLLEWASAFFAGGILLLVYGNFLLLLPVLIYAFCQSVQWDRFKNRIVFLPEILGMVLIFFTPTLLWIGLLKLNGTAYYFFETNYYHELVWIPESIQQSPALFFHRLGIFTLEYLNTMKWLVIMIVFSLIIFFTIKIKISLSSEPVRNTVFIFGCFFLFYWLLGFYDERLTNTLIPIFICFWIAAIGNKISTRKMIIVSGSLAITWHLYVLLSYGPFS